MAAAVECDVDRVSKREWAALRPAPRARSTTSGARAARAGPAPRPGEPHLGVRAHLGRAPQAGARRGGEHDPGAPAPAPGAAGAPAGGALLVGLPAGARRGAAGLRLLHGGDGPLADAVRLVLPGGAHPPGVRRRLHGAPHRVLGDPAGARCVLGSDGAGATRLSCCAIATPSSGRRSTRCSRTGRTRRPHAGPSSHRQCLRGTMGRERAARMPGLAADHRRAAPLPGVARVRRPLQRGASTPRTRAAATARSAIIQCPRGRGRYWSDRLGGLLHEYERAVGEVL